MNSLLSRFHPTRAGPEADLGFAVTGDLPRPLDAKAFQKIYKAMDKVVKSLQNPRLNLSRSPPCLIDILPDIYMKLKDINNLGDTGSGEQQDFYYTTVNNIYDKCRRVNQLFKEHKDEILQENADSRKQLINLTIVIAYIFADLKALFNDAGHFDPNFRIAKEEAERWWKTTFPGRVIVPWGTFKEQIVLSFPTLSKLELSRLKSTIDLTCNDHVSVFEFDVFTRLFAPWTMLMKNFRRLTFHPGYMASATFENVKTILSKHREKPGSYVFRMCCSKLGFWSIGYVTDHCEQRRDRISQIVVRDGKPIVEALMEGAQKGYYLYPNGDPVNPDLSELMHVRPKPQFQVTEEQFEEYSMIGSTFQECKICNIRDKDIRLELCGHFMCSKCLNQWLSKGTGCPFCRCEIRSTQAVVMQPFTPSSREGAVFKPEVVPGAAKDFSGSLPPPDHPPPDLPPGFLENDDSAGRRSSVAAPEIPETPRRIRPPDFDSSSSDDPVTDERAYVNITGQNQRNPTLPQPPTSLATCRPMTSPTSSVTSSTSPAAAVTSLSNAFAVSQHSSCTGNTQALTQSPTSPLPSSGSSVVTSQTTSPDSAPGAAGGQQEPTTGSVPSPKPRSKPFDPKDGDAHTLISLPPPPPVPLAASAVAPPLPPNRPPTSASSAPPLPPNRPRSGSITNTAVSPTGFRQGLTPLPPLPTDRGSQEAPYNTPMAQEDLYNTPTAQDLYNIPTAQDLYNTPKAQEDLYNTPTAQDLYNTPLRQEETYNVPAGAEESEYNVPAAL